ncbi:MAG: hypothetical protein R3Y26_08950 [Rikenellaceae bacterium]
MKRTFTSLLFVAALAMTSFASQTANANELSSTEFSTITMDGDEWDKILDEYDSAVTKLISLYKKTQEGDLTAMTDYAAASKSLISMQSKIDKAKSDLTVEQATRYAKISLKVANAIK